MVWKFHQNLTPAATWALYFSSFSWIRFSCHSEPYMFYSVFKIVKAMVFPVVMYRCESWTTKKAEHQRADAFKLPCWRTLLRVRWIGRRSNQSIVKEINPEYSLEDWCWSWSSNTLATWCEELTRSKWHCCWERLRAGGEEGDGE